MHSGLPRRGAIVALTNCSTESSGEDDIATNTLSKPLTIYANPMAARGRSRPRVAAAAARLAANGIDCGVVWSERSGDIEQGIRTAASKGVRRVVVAGGDGSVHEAVNGIVASDAAVELGILPMGTGNDFAKAAGIPLDWEQACERLIKNLASNERPVVADVGCINGRYFANSAGIGFDARVAAAAARIRLPIGDAVYPIALLGLAARGLASAPVRIRLRKPGAETAVDVGLDGPTLLVNFANGFVEGGRFRLAPHARIDDGQLDFVHVAPVSLPRLLALLPRIMRGNHLAEPEVTCEPVEHCLLECERALPSHLDGELQEPTDRFELGLVRGALRVL